MISAQRGHTKLPQEIFSYLLPKKPQVNKSVLRFVALAFDAENCSWGGITQIEPQDTKKLVQKTILAAHHNDDSRFIDLFAQTLDSWTKAGLPETNQLPFIFSTIWHQDRTLLGRPKPELAEMFADMTHRFGLSSPKDIKSTVKVSAQTENLPDGSQEELNALKRSIAIGDAPATRHRLTNIRRGIERNEQDFKVTPEFIETLPDLITMDLNGSGQPIIQELVKLLPYLIKPDTDVLVAAQVQELISPLKILAGGLPHLPPSDVNDLVAFHAATQCLEKSVMLECAALPENLREGWGRLFNLQSRALLGGDRDVLRFVMPWTFKQHMAVSNLAFSFIALEGKEDLFQLARVVGSESNLTIKALDHARGLSVARFGSCNLPSPSELKLTAFSKVGNSLSIPGVKASSVIQPKRNTLTLPADSVPIRVSKVPAEFWNFRPVNRAAVRAIMPGWSS